MRGHLKKYSIKSASLGSKTNKNLINILGNKKGALKNVAKHIAWSQFY